MEKKCGKGDRRKEEFGKGNGKGMRKGRMEEAGGEVGKQDCGKGEDCGREGEDIGRGGMRGGERGRGHEGEGDKYINYYYEYLFALYICMVNTSITV